MLLDSRNHAAARERGLLLVAAALAAGCGSDADEAVTVHLWAMGQEGAVVQQLMPGFEREYPGIRVSVQQIPWTAAHEKLLTAHVGDVTPDVAQLGNTWIPEFVALDAIEPLDAWLEGSAAVVREDYFPGIWDTNVIDDRAYGVPWYVDTRVVFYRADLLQDAGYETFPETWDAWRDAMRRIKRRMKPDQYPLLLPTNEWAPPVILGMQAGASLLRDGGQYGAFSDVAFRRAFAFYLSLFHEGLAPMQSSAEVGNVHQEFTRGNIAMYISGPWNIGEFRSRLPQPLQDAWMTAALPGPGGPGVSLAGGSSLVLFRDSRHKAAAWQLIEYLSRPAQLVRFYELTGDLPARRAPWRSPVLSESPYLVAFRDQLERVRPLPKVPELEQIVQELAEHAERAIRGRVSAADVLARLDREVDRLLEKRRWLLAREAIRQ